MNTVPPGQNIVYQAGDVRLMAMPSAYFVAAENHDTDVVAHGSFMGVWPARFMGSHTPRAIIGVDCGIGKDGAGIAGIWYLEAQGIPAVAARVDDVQLLSGEDVLASGIVSRMNALAADCGVREGMRVDQCAELLIRNKPVDKSPHEHGQRTVVATHPSGRQIVCTHSIAFPLPEDKNHNVLCTGGFAGSPNIIKASPFGFICSDGARGKNDGGLAGLGSGIPGATVDVWSARIGDGLSTYYEGIISACNEQAASLGVRVGQKTREAAWLMVSGRDSAIID